MRDPYHHSYYAPGQRITLKLQIFVPVYCLYLPGYKLTNHRELQLLPKYNIAVKVWTLVFAKQCWRKKKKDTNVDKLLLTTSCPYLKY